MNRVNRIMLYVVLGILLYGCSAMSIQLLNNSCYNSKKNSGLEIKCNKEK